MRLLIDSDVLLDFIGERESTAAAWVKLHAMELAGAAELWVSAEAFGEVRTALAEALSDHDARSALRGIRLPGRAPRGPRRAVQRA